MLKKETYMWHQGALVPWDDATIPLLTHTFHYGVGAFEGIRSYETHDGGAQIFRLREHIDRLFDSAKICLMDVPYTKEEVMQACVGLMQANNLKESYLRPIIYMGYGAMGLGAQGNPICVSVATWKWGAYLGEEGASKGISCKISSFTRPHINTYMARGKITGQYVNSILAKREAQMDGYHEALMVDNQGQVVEGTGENLFVVKNGTIYTPGMDKCVLEGITRDSVITILRNEGYNVVERALTRDTLYLADEIFLTGTAAEITPVRELDHRSIGTGTPGPITSVAKRLFVDITRGKDKRYEQWLHKF